MSGRLQNVNRLTKTWAGRCVLAVIFWTLLSVFFSLPSLSKGAGLISFRGELAWCWSWGLITPLIIAFDRQLPFSGKQIARRILLHLLASLIVAAVFRPLNVAVSAAVGIGSWNALRIPNLSALWRFEEFTWNWFYYWMIVGIVQAHGYYQRYLSTELQLERMERSFTEARLNALRMQLDPHFLFNALNTISSQVERDPKLTRRMIEHLGDLLRMSLESKDR